MSPKFKNIFVKTAFVIVGILAGVIYWKFVGCNSGTCPLTSNWYSAGMFGGLAGLLISDSIKKTKPEKELK